MNASTSALASAKASSARDINRLLLTAELAGSIEIRATLVIDVTARGPGGASMVETMRVPGCSKWKLFLLQTGICRSMSGASVRGCRTFAPL